MKKTPSALKWLAEKRARTAHDLKQTVRIATEVARRLAGLNLDLPALARSVRIYDARIDPTAKTAADLPRDVVSARVVYGWLRKELAGRDKGPELPLGRSRAKDTATTAQQASGGR